MGKAGLAVLVLGVAACRSQPSGNVSTSGPSDEGTSTTPEPSSTLPESTSTSFAPGQEGSWHRVNLGFVSAYILYRGGEAAIVDTGVAGSEGAIDTGLGEIGLSWDDVGHIIITHRHPDHQGSLDAVLSQSGDTPWYAGAGDIDAIDASVDGRIVGDGDRVFDLDMIETPGHTPGHISVLDPAAGILVAGDALNGADGGVAGANPAFSEDMGLANVSVQKLAGFDYQVALFGHGEPVLENASEAVASLAATLG